MLKNIIFVSDFGYINGGNSKVTIENALLASKHFNVTLFVGEDKLDDRILNSNINVVKAGGEEFLKSKHKINSSFKFIYDKAIYKKFDSLLEKFDKNDTIIHIHSWPKVLSPSIFKAINKRGFKILITCHDYFSVCPNGGLFNYKKQTICNCKNRFSCYFKNCDSRSYIYKIIRNFRYDVQHKYMSKIEKKGNLNFGIISKSQEQHFRKVFKNASYHFIPNNIELFNGDRIKVENNKKLLYIGRLSEEKGVNLLLEAMKNLPYELDVIGDGPLFEKLSKNNALPNVRFLGWYNKPQINEALLEARAVIFPSIWHEGSPLLIPEVMSAGIPTLVSDVCNGKDFIKDGENGWLVNVNSKSEFIQKLDNIFKTDISEISKHAYEIRRNYTSAIFDKYLNVLKEVLN